jgi:hypothetical protein
MYEAMLKVSSLLLKPFSGVTVKVYVTVATTPADTD